MGEKHLFERDSFNQKNPKHPQKNVSIIYSPRAVKIEPATSIRIDTEMTGFLPQISKGFITSTVIGNEVNELFQGKHRLWVEVLSKSSEDSTLEKINSWVFCSWTWEFNISLCTKQKEGQKENINIQIEDAKGNLATYARRDVNQAAKIAPCVNKAATNGINNTAKQRINQIISQGGKEVKHVLPKIPWGAIKDVYQMPFKLLRNFGKQQLNEIKRKILR